MSEMENRNKITDQNAKRPPADEIYTGQEYQGSEAKKEKAETPPGIGKDISILVVITLAAGLLLGLAYGITKDPIAHAQAEAKAKAQKAVMPDADSFNVLYTADGNEGEVLPDTVSAAISDAGIDTTTVSQIDEALDENGERMGYVVTSSNPEGYGGDVEIMSGIVHDEEEGLTIQGISFLSLSETAGMGMRAKDEEFSGQFEGLKLVEDALVSYVKDGANEPNEIDAISGCTITTSAVTDNVNAALIAVNEAKDLLSGASGGKASGAKEETEAQDTAGEKAASDEEGEESE